MTTVPLHFFSKFTNFYFAVLVQSLSRGRIILALCALVFWGSSSALPLGFTEENVLSGLTEPVHLATLPNDDGRMFVLESMGSVQMFTPSDAVPTTTTILSIGNVANINERGAVSITLDPNFETNGFFYIYYTHIGSPPEPVPPTSNASIRNRISRFTFDGASSAGSEVLAWEDNRSVFNQSFHFGGGLDFGPDGMLYLSTGEEFIPSQSQDLTQAGGKIIRLNTANITAATPWVRGAANTHIIPVDNPVWPAGSLGRDLGDGIKESVPHALGPYSACENVHW